MVDFKRVMGDNFMRVSFCFLFFLLIHTVAFSESFENRFIGNVIPADDSEFGVILVDKSQKKLFYIKVSGGKHNVAASYPIIYGGNEGNKAVSGDNKTPEGVYYITGYFSGASLFQRYGAYSKMYGAGSLPLNYPNAIDRIKKKTGGGIWIHGNDVTRPATQGCVALENKDFEGVRKEVSTGSPVVISERALYFDNASYKNHSEKVLGAFDGFISSWRDSDANTFKNHIHEDYSTSAANAKSYYANKKTLMDIYPERVIINDNTKIFMDSLQGFVADTNQFYCAPNLSTYGNKKYYFELANDGNYKLISEEFSPRNSNEVISKDINKFIKDWAAALSAKNFDKYIELYSKKFKSANMGYEAWYNHKKDLFADGRKIDVEVSDIKWTRTNGGYNVSLTQKYSLGDFSESGIKTIELAGCPTKLKIVGESPTKAELLAKAKPAIVEKPVVKTEPIKASEPSVVAKVEVEKEPNFEKKEESKEKIEPKNEIEKKAEVVKKPEPEVSPVAKVEQPSDNEITQDITSFVQNWAAAWNEQNIDKYIEFYSKKFRSNNMGYNAWYDYKKRLFSRGDAISVEVSNIKWTKTKAGFSVSFTQKYSSNNIKDTGIKTLELMGSTTELKIIGESWRAR